MVTRASQAEQTCEQRHSGVPVLGSMESLQCRMSMGDQAGEGGSVVKGLEGPAGRKHLKSSCHLKQSSDMTRPGV